MFFIETILAHPGLRDYFSEINTNPGYVDEQGRLRIGSHNGGHGCNLCPPNMCKGHVIEGLVREQGASKRFIYLGDGSGDYCPSLKLKARDFVIPSKDFRAYDLIVSDPKRVVAELREWTDGAELESVLLGLVSAIAAASLQVYVECKFETIYPMDTLLKALPPVPH